MGKKAENPVGAVENSLSIIQTLRELNGATISELAQHLPLSKGAIHNHLATLRQSDYVEKREDTYHVGLRWLEIGGFARDERALFNHAKPPVDELASETGEHALVTTEVGGMSMYVYQERGPKAVTTDSYVGIRLPMHCTGTGKAMLAELDDDVIDEIIDQHGLKQRTQHTITNRSELADRLEQIRERGFALDDEERIDGMRGVGVSIVLDDVPVGSISISGPTHRLKGDLFREEIPELLTGAAREIEINMTFDE